MQIPEGEGPNASGLKAIFNSLCGAGSHKVQEVVHGLLNAGRQRSIWVPLTQIGLQDEELQDVVRS